jgi:hypothetical protein
LETQSDRLAAAQIGIFWAHSQRLRPDSGSMLVAEGPGIGVCLAQDLHSLVDGALVRGDAD